MNLSLLKYCKLMALGMLCGIGASFAQDTKPVKEHVRLLVANGDTNYVKYTSKLTHVVELNFTMNYHHNQGKPILTGALNNIAQREGFTVSHFTGASEGTSRGSVPDFTLDDLKEGQVIFSNNISEIGQSGVGNAKWNAIRNAIVDEGIGYFGIHASGDQPGNTNWGFYLDSLHPMVYGGHLENDKAAPVYKWEGSKNHIALQGILEEDVLISSYNGQPTRGVLMGVDENGNDIEMEGVPFRMMRNEWYQFGRDIREVEPYASRVVQLLNYDYRSVGTALPADKRFKGGNMHSFLQKIGKGWTAYLPTGHDNLDLNDNSPGNTSFDGGTGDLEQYIENVLYFLAGYDPSICADDRSDCIGLPIVDDDFMLTERVVEEPVTQGIKVAEKLDQIQINSRNIKIAGQDKFSVEIVDVKGHIISTVNDVSSFELSTADFKSGLYYVKIKVAGLGDYTRSILKL